MTQKIFRLSRIILINSYQSRPQAGARETTMFCGFRIFPDKKCFSFRKTASGKNDGNVARVRSTTCTERPEDGLESRRSRFRTTKIDFLN